MTEPPPDPARGWRITFDRRLTIGTVIHACLLLAGGIWALSELKTEFATQVAIISVEIEALRHDLDEFKGDMKREVAELRFELSAKEDKPFVRAPQRP